MKPGNQRGLCSGDEQIRSFLNNRHQKSHITKGTMVKKSVNEKRSYYRSKSICSNVLNCLNQDYWQ